MNSDLLRLAGFIPKLEGGTFQAGVWEGGETDAEGVMTMPWFDRAADMVGFVQACYPLMLKDFKWPEWIHTEDAQRVHADLEHATLEELCQFITAIVRQERFVEGVLASAYETGDFLRIARRAEQLAHVS